MEIRTFRDLIVWQRGMKLATAIYPATEKMPRSEIFGLTSQIRRAATSIPLNIAEGFGKHTRPEFVHGLRTAMGSLCEVMTAYEIATNLQMIPVNQRILELLAEVDRLLQALIMRLDEKTQEEQKAKRKQGRKQ